MIMKWFGLVAENKQADLVKMPKFLPYLECIIGCNVAEKYSPIAFKKINWLRFTSIKRF